MACAVGLVTPALWFGSLVTPGEEAVKIRNGFVAEVADVREFDWQPGAVPPSFKLNRSDPTEQFRRAADSIRAGANGLEQPGLGTAVAISRHLMQSPDRKGGAIQRNLGETYREITSNGQGYCADFTRVFTGLSIAMGLPVRTWSISFDGFGAGHSFNEIFDAATSKWVMIDSFHSLYFVDGTTGQPLSVLEVHDRLLFPDESIAGIDVRPIVATRIPFRSDNLVIDYYRRGFSQLALVWGNNVFDYDASNVIRAASHASRHVERAVAIGLAVYPDLKIYPRGRSQRDVEALFRARDRFLTATLLLALSVPVFGYLLANAWKDPVARRFRRRARIVQ